MTISARIHGVRFHIRHAGISREEAAEACQALAKSFCIIIARGFLNDLIQNFVVSFVRTAKVWLNPLRLHTLVGKTIVSVL